MSCAVSTSLGFVACLCVVVHAKSTEFRPLSILEFGNPFMLSVIRLGELHLFYDKCHKGFPITALFGIAPKLGRAFKAAGMALKAAVICAQDIPPRRPRRMPLPLRAIALLSAVTALRTVGLPFAL
jgi:hypothetical protein